MGWLATTVLYAIAKPDQDQLTPEVAILHSSLTAVGFVFAEGVMALLIRRSAGKSTVRSRVGTSPETTGASPAVSAIPQDGLRAAGRGALGGVLAVILIVHPRVNPIGLLQRDTIDARRACPGFAVDGRCPHSHGVGSRRSVARGPRSRRQRLSVVWRESMGRGSYPGRSHRSHSGIPAS